MIAGSRPNHLSSLRKNIEQNCVGQRAESLSQGDICQRLVSLGVGRKHARSLFHVLEHSLLSGIFHDPAELLHSIYRKCRLDKPAM